MMIWLYFNKKILKKLITFEANSTIYKKPENWIYSRDTPIGTNSTVHFLAGKDSLLNEMVKPQLTSIPLFYSPTLIPLPCSLNIVTKSKFSIILGWSPFLIYNYNSWSNRNHTFMNTQYKYTFFIYKTFSRKTQEPKSHIYSKYICDPNLPSLNWALTQNKKKITNLHKNHPEKPYS